MANTKEEKAVAKNGKTGMTLPTEDHFRNAQLDLFQSFLCNTEDERDRLSNTIDLWDSLPKYAVSRQAMTKLRKDGGFLELLELEFDCAAALRMRHGTSKSPWRPRARGE
jgi:hypothetical protein